eukprot:TRINITY_DN7875_c0_g1_i1.p1 TRINITY_DN7875_c0_g1~~TRINITY_DN7875_c0_g1_i1.p1  ORF type:complete len:288 (-),score=98.89 TRINITY_DN7875_c0_g1_i1:209-1072(-)
MAALKEKHRVAMDELNGQFNTALSLCRSRKHNNTVGRQLLGSGINLGREQATNNAIQNQINSAGQLKNAYNNQRNVVNGQASSERTARDARTKEHQEKLEAEIQRHGMEESVLRSRFVRVMALCQRQGWQMDVADRAVKTRQEQQQQAVANAAVLAAAVNTEAERVGQAKVVLQRTLNSLQATQSRLEQAVAAGEDGAILNAENAQRDAQQSVQQATQTAQTLQDRLAEAQGRKVESDNLLAAGEGVVAALKETASRATVGNCYHGDCDTLDVEGPDTPQVKVLGSN